MGKHTDSLLHGGIELASMLIIAIIVVSSLIIILNIYLATPSPQVAVTTTSMEPVYGGYQKIDNTIVPLDGDVLIIKNELPKVGDVIVYKSINPEFASTPIVHQVVAVQRDPSNNNSLMFLTQGDNYLTNPSTDVQAGISSNNGTWVKQADVIGVVIFRIPWIGWLSLQIQNLNLRIFLLLALGIILVLMFVEEEKEVKNDAQGNNSKATDENGNTKKQNTSIVSKIKYSVIKGNSFKQWVLHTGTGNIVVVIVIIIIGVSMFGVGLYSTGTNTIQLYTPGNELWNSNTALTLTPTNTPNMEIYHDINGTPTTLYLIHTHLQVFSHGLFNWVERIELHINQTSAPPVYVWAITYAYNGNFMVNTNILLYINSTYTTGSYHEQLIYTIVSAGFLAQPIQTTEYNFTFQL